jgi:hypothetical protein
MKMFERAILSLIQIYSRGRIWLINKLDYIIKKIFLVETELIETNKCSVIDLKLIQICILYKFKLERSNKNEK